MFASVTVISAVSVVIGPEISLPHGSDNSMAFSGSVSSVHGSTMSSGSQFSCKTNRSCGVLSFPMVGTPSNTKDPHAVKCFSC